MDKAKIVDVLGVEPTRVETLPAFAQQYDEMFVLQFDCALSQGMLDRIKKGWEDAWDGPAPNVLIVDGGARLYRAEGAN
jgi:hypothetical protein